MVDCPFLHGVSYSQVDPHRDRNSSDQHDFGATGESVLSLSQNKPLNIYKVVVDALFTTFRSLIRVAVDDIISPLCCIVLKRESEEENKKGREGHRSKSLGPLARGRKTTWEGWGALGRFSAEVDDETRTSGAFLARLNCSMLSPGLIRVKLLWVKWR